MLSFPRFPLALATVLGSLALVGCSRTEGPPAPAATQRIDITVTSDGFVPAQARVKVGQPVTLVVTRKVERTCATDIVIKDYGISKPLPLDTPVLVTLTPTKAGKIHYACAMDMIAADLVAE